MSNKSKSRKRKQVLKQVSVMDEMHLHDVEKIKEIYEQNTFYREDKIHLIIKQ